VQRAQVLVLRPGEEGALPTDLLGALEEAVLVAEPDATARQRLELAAVLGGRFSTQSWAAASGGDPAELAHWCAAGLLRHMGPESWCFARSMMRDVLLRAAQKSGRGVRHHGAIAGVLQGAQPGRLGTHLLGAGRFSEAEPLLAQAAQAAKGTTAMRLLERWRQAILGLGMPRSDPRRIACARLTAGALVNLGQHEPAGVLAAEIIRDAADPEEIGLAWIVKGQIARAARDADEAFRCYDRALQSSQASKVAHAVHFGRAIVHRMLLDYDAAALSFDCALEHADPVQALRIAVDRIPTCEGLGHDEQNLQALSHVRDEASGLGHSELVAVANARLGMLCRQLGRLEDAERHLGLALQRFAGTQSRNAVFIRANLAVLPLRSGQPELALRSLNEVRRSASLLGMRAFVVQIDELLLAASVDVDEHTWRAASTAVQAPGLPAELVIWAAEVAGDRAFDRGHPERARALWQRGRTHAQGLPGTHPARLESKLAQLP
jgi:tetratricopeptide (TPR) repeat protein